MAVMWSHCANVPHIGEVCAPFVHITTCLPFVYQIDATHKRLLWIGQHRRAKTLLRFFRWFGKERTAALAFVCSDMWKPYLNVIAEKLGRAVHVLDRFQIGRAHV